MFQHALFVPFAVGALQARTLQQAGNLGPSGFMSALSQYNHSIAYYPAHFIVIVFIQNIAFHFFSCCVDKAAST
jgi:hypothetical protein